uniref:Niban apoptosis regulator 1a n=1 Tax=Astyanax mexicanus TaxID=7994 RepID=A0A3B1K6H3_ASTMX
ILQSSTSCLDDSFAHLGRAQAELKNFAPFYKKQYTLAYLSHIHEELVQRKEQHTQLLKQRPPGAGNVLYEDHVVYFDDNRKWKERYAVVRANYSLECHESYETYVKGTPPLFKLLPTGGTSLTSEETYMQMVDKCFPDTNNTKEDFAPPVAAMPGDFPVYLRLPYRRDYYFCFYQEDMQTKFISILSDCIRHQNQDFLKKKTCEVQAFVKAIHLYRQEKGHYEMWDMLIGSDVLANLIMEDLLPTLEKDLLPRLKAKKMEKKRVWFATVEAAYYLVQETLMEGMTALKDECKEYAKQKSALMRSDMDQIMNSRTFLESKLKATVAEPATKYCMEHVEPHLPAILEEVMGPISQGFKEARELSESMMEQLCQDYKDSMNKDELHQALEAMKKPNLQTCYEKVSSLQDHIQELQQSFSYPNSKRLEHSTQIDIQQQYDYDSSTVRKRIFQDALINITLPSIKELPTYEQYIFADYVPFINAENVYEDILQQILEKEVSTVVKEAASMKKYDLFTESRFNFSVSSLHSTPPGSIPGSPAHISTSPSRKHTMPPSPLLTNGTVREPAAQVVLQKLKAVEQEVEVQAVETGEKNKLEEKREKEVSTVPSSVPATQTVQPTLMEETVEAIPAATEENTKVKSALASFLSTETAAPSGTTTTEIPLAVLKDVEPVANGTAPIQSYSTEDMTERLDGLAQKNEPPTATIHASTEAKSNANANISISSAPQENPLLLDLGESDTTLDVFPSDDVSWGTDSEREEVESAKGDEPQSELTVEESELYTTDEFIIGNCESTEDAEESKEVFTHSAADDSESEDNASTGSPEDGKKNPQPTALEATPQSQPASCTEQPAETPTVAQPEARPLDCIKEIRDLVVEVIEVEEVVQRYPDDGEV